MTASSEQTFKRHYAAHLKHLRLKVSMAIRIDPLADIKIDPPADADNRQFASFSFSR